MMMMVVVVAMMAPVIRGGHGPGWQGGYGGDRK